MRPHSKLRRWTCCCTLAALLSAMGLLPLEVRAEKPRSLDFRITARYCTGQYYDHRNHCEPASFTASGAIWDDGWFQQTDSYIDENGNTWLSYTFYGSAGRFGIEWLPPGLGEIEEGVEYLIELTPGNGAYQGLTGIGIAKARIRDVFYWDDTWGVRVKRYDRIVTWTIDGILIP